MARLILFIVFILSLSCCNQGSEDWYVLINGVSFNAMIVGIPEESNSELVYQHNCIDPIDFRIIGDHQDQKPVISIDGNVFSKSNSTPNGFQMIPEKFGFQKIDICVSDVCKEYWINCIREKAKSVDQKTKSDNNPAEVLIANNTTKRYNNTPNENLNEIQNSPSSDLNKKPVIQNSVAAVNSNIQEPKNKVKSSNTIEKQLNLNLKQKIKPLQKKHQNHFHQMNKNPDKIHLHQHLLVYQLVIVDHRIFLNLNHKEQCNIRLNQPLEHNSRPNFQILLNT